MSVQRHTLSPSSVKRFPALMEGNQLIFETKTLSSDAIDDGKAMGEVVISATIAGVDNVEVGRQKLIPGDRPLFLVPNGITGPFRLTGELFPWITGSYLVTVWASTVESENGGDSGPDDSGGSGSTGRLLELTPLPSSNGISIDSGRAIFDAGTVEKGWNADRSLYTLSTTVTDSEFWKIGFRSTETFSRGRLRFGSGVGPSVIGLAPTFDDVDFALTQWGFYIASSTEVRVFEFRNGAIAHVAQFPWSPARDVAIRIDGDQVYYEMLIGNDWQVIFTSNHPFSDECHLVGTLGPQAFVFNVQYEDI